MSKYPLWTEVLGFDPSPDPVKNVSEPKYATKSVALVDTLVDSEKEFFAVAQRECIEKTRLCKIIVND